MDIVYGINPALEFLRHRPDQAIKVVIAKGKTGKELQLVGDLARARHIPVVLENPAYLYKVTDGAPHQGAIVFCRPYQYRTVEALLGDIAARRGKNLLILLDGITDPQNLGSIIRVSHCFGADGVIIPKNRAAEVTPAVIKAAAGATAHTPVAKATNLVETIKYLKDNGFWVYGADPAAEINLGELNFQGNIALVMGSEGSGMRELVRKSCDFLIRIPLQGTVDSLNVSVAAGIILYRIMDQRNG